MNIRGIASIVAACALVFSAGAIAGDSETARTVGNVTYVSGGVGTESLDQLRSIAGDFNLKLVFAMKSGEYLSGVKTTIADAAGKSLLEVDAEGPWLLARLPAGRYKISATFAGNSLTRNVTVATAKLNTLDLRWASE